jgi:hypothetical protein
MWEMGREGPGRGGPGEGNVGQQLERTRWNLVTKTGHSVGEGVS